MSKWLPAVPGRAGAEVSENSKEPNREVCGMHNASKVVGVRCLMGD